MFNFLKKTEVNDFIEQKDLDNKLNEKDTPKVTPDNIIKQEIKIAQGKNVKQKELAKKDTPKVTPDNIIKQKIKTSQPESVGEELPDIEWNEDGTPKFIAVPEKKEEIKISGPSLTEKKQVIEYSDFGIHLPKCSERSIYLIFSCLAELDKKSSLFSSTLLLERINKEFDTLKSCLKEEGQESLIFSKSFVSTIDCMTEKKYADAIDTFGTFLKDYQPFNIAKLLTLVKKANDTGLQIKGKDIIILLGITGAGKSTLMHYLLKSIMGIKATEGENPITYIGPIEIKNEELVDVTCSPCARSETKNMKAVSLKLKDYDLKEKEMYLIDSPGFEHIDAIDFIDGPVQDVANVIGIIKAIQGAKNVKPLIVFSKESGDRLQGVKSTAQIISRMVPKFQDYSEAFSYVLSKCKETEKKNFSNIVNDFSKHLNTEEKRDKAFKLLLSDLSDHEKIAVINLLEENPELLRNSFMDGLVNGKLIPGTAFSCTITDDSKKAIKLQVEKHKSRIKFALEKANYELVKSKLNELKELTEILKDDEIEKEYKQCNLYVFEILQKVLQQNSDELIHKITKGTKFLEEKDLIQYKKAIDQLKIFKEFPEFSKDFDEKKLTSNSTSFIQKQAEYYLKMTQEANANFSNYKLQDGLDNLLMLSKYFEDIKVIYNLAKLPLIDELKKYRELAKIEISKFDFSKAQMHIKKIIEIRKSFYKHITENELKEFLEGLGKEVNNQLQKKFIEIEEFFLVEDWKDTHCLAFANYMKVLLSAKKFSLLKNYISDEKIDEIEKNLTNKINLKFEDLTQKMEKELTQKSLRESILWIYSEKSIKQLNFLKISGLENNTSKIVEIACKALQKVKEEFESKIEFFDAKIDNITSIELEKLITILKNSKWIADYKSTFYREILIAVEDKLRLHFAQLKNMIENMPSDLNKIDLDIINELDLKILKLQKMVVTENSKKFLQNLIKDFENKKIHICKEIINSFDFEKQSIKNDEIELEKIIKLQEKYYSFDPLLVLKNSDISGANSIEKVRLMKEYCSVEIIKVQGNCTSKIALEKSNFLQWEHKINSNVEPEKDEGFFANLFNPLKKTVVKQYDRSVKHSETQSRINKIEQESKNTINRLVSDHSKLSHLEKKYDEYSKAQKIILDENKCSTIDDLNKEIIGRKNYIAYRKKSGYYPLFNSFDAEKIKKSLKYTKLFADSNSIVDKINKYLEQYEFFIKTDIKIFSDGISDQKGNEDSEMLDRYVEVLSKRMEDLKNFSDKYPEIFGKFQEDILKKSIDMFEDKVILLSKQMEECQKLKNIFSLKAKLNAVTQLKILDKYLKEPSFSNLSSYYEKIFQESLMKVTTEIQDCIERYEFEKLGKLLNKLKDTNLEHYSIVYERLELRLKKLFIETNNYLNSMENFICKTDNEKLPKLLINLQHLIKANNDLFEYLNQKDQKIFEKNIINIDEKVTTKLSKAKIEIDNLIEQYSFIEAKPLINLLIENTNLLIDSCNEELKKEIFGLEEKWKQAIEKMISKYQKAEIESYNILKPYEVVKKLKELGYLTEDVEKYFKEKFVDELNTLERNSKNISQLEKKLNEFNSLINYLPESNKESITSKISEIQLRITKKKEIWQEKLKLLANEDGNAAEIKKIMEDENVYNDTTINIIVAKLSDYNKDISECLNDFLKKSDIDSQEITTIFKNKVCPRLKELLDYAKNFKETSEINNICNESFSNIKNKMKKLHDSILSFVNKIETSSAEIIPVIKTNFDVLKHFYIVLTQENIELSVDEFEKSVSLIFNMVKKDNHTYFENAQDALKNNNISVLKSNFTKLEKLNFLIVQCSFFDEVKELIPSSELKTLVLENVKGLAKYLKEVELINNTTKDNLLKRKGYYEDLKDKINSLIEKESLKNFYDIDAQENFKNKYWCLNFLKEKISSLSVQANMLVDSMKTNELSIDNLNALNHLCNHLNTLKVIFVPEFFEEDITHIEKIEEAILNLVYQSLSVMEENIKNPSVFSKELFKVKQISKKIAFVKEKVNEKIDEQLKIFKEKNSKNLLEDLVVHLKLDAKGIGTEILNEHDTFKGMTTYAFNVDTRKLKLEDVINAIETDNIKIDKKVLTEKYNEFFKIYWDELVVNYLTKGKKEMSLQPLVEAIKLEAKKILECQKTKTFTWNEEAKNKLPRLIAHLFALLTLVNADKYFEMETSSDRLLYLRQPHAAQVLTVFSAFGIGDIVNEVKKEALTKLLSNLVEKKTGTGKSDCLGIMSMALALLNHDVMCACFSNDLSYRDFKAFENIFDMLGLINKENPRITYGPFNELCEQAINKPEDIRTLILNTVLAEKSDSEKKTINETNDREQVLFLDEVDTFFTINGKLFKPSVTIKDKKITKLIEHIWSEATKTGFSADTKTFAGIKNSPAYKDCCPLFKKEWEFILEDAVTKMIHNFANLKDHKYVCKDQKIGYVDQDGISYNIIKEYFTLGATLKEFHNAKISNEFLDELMGISIDCGKFSYKQALTKFKAIIGLSGTLKPLAEFERKVLAELGILKYIYMPSVFGDVKLKFDHEKDVCIVNDEEYYKKVNQSIDEMVEQKRPVLVFFETEEELNEFFNSDAFANKREKTQKITPKLNREEREHCIKQATEAAQITLLTREFRRGTDFKCYNKEINQAGGVHVIQISLAESLGEEIQTEGRTARNGNQGSFEIFIPEKDLKKFLEIINKTIEELKKEKNVYKILNEARNKLYEDNYKSKTKQFEYVKKEDEKTQKFLINIKNNTEDSIKDSIKYIREINPPAELKEVTSLFLLLDITGSMDNLIVGAKKAMFETYIRIARIVPGAKVPVKIGLFKNYEDKKEIYQESDWLYTSEELQEYMKDVKAKGGGSGGEAVEIGLFHVNKENKNNKIGQVLLFGDAPPNKKTGDYAISEKRAKMGESFWKENGYPEPTHYKKELKELQNSNIPVSSCFLDKYAEKKFRRIAKETGGDCFELNIGSEKNKPIETLTHLFSKRMITLAVKKEESEKYLEEYKKTYEDSWRGPK